MLTKQFYENGFEVFDRKKYISYINVSEIEWEYEGGLNNDYHPKNNKEFIDKCLLTIHYEIQNDIVPQSIMRKRRIWEGVNYPQKGLLVAVNCLNNFQHKAEKSNCKRIVSSFYFDL